MIPVRKRSWLPANLLLFAMLVTAQSGALAHAFKHEAATPQVQNCAICVTVSQLHASCVPAIGAAETDSYVVSPPVSQALPHISLHTLAARQRSPPISTLS